MKDCHDLLRELREEYLGDLPGRISRLKLAIQNRDSSSVQVFLHNLKGTGTTYGLKEISVCAENFESVVNSLPASTPSNHHALLWRKIEQLPLQLEKIYDFYCQQTKVK